MVEVRVDVQRGCQLVHQVRDAGAQAQGVLDFGQTARLSDPAGPLGSVLLNQRPPRLECNPDTLYQVQVDGGQHGGIGEVRYLASNQPNSRPIPYRLYQDPAWRTPLAVNTAQHARVPDSGTVELPLYARIDGLAEVPRVGHYSDLLKVTVTW
ncbi:spore coat protein U domain-containing protein [Pseudomonas sp. MAFF212428]|uniref:Spore coat protein U domain-containing protein n=1 Tax=Pseudomonas brassicae TaxID=2708063 RepID=A0A6B3NVX2_9PSED|nr:spore coat U domain-containing protein [Pseudomonas brassicae]NER61677.1 spore coat protein U domain-containing protein [Pseudomonas brassicae]NER64370.1 spore coat protein U domain-containing protein [Pseudomonas brassicae]